MGKNIIISRFIFLDYLSNFISSFSFITENNYKITLYISLSGGIVHHQRSCSLTHLLLSAAPHCFSSTSNLSSNFFYAACLSHAEFFFCYSNYKLSQLSADLTAKMQSRNERAQLGYRTDPINFLVFNSVVIVLTKAGFFFI